jgi:hypothetical protein
MAEDPRGKDSLWRRVKHPETGERMLDVGILADGTLHNPNGYPDDIVRAAVEQAIARRGDRRKASAAKAAVTRKRRHDKRVHMVATKLLRGEGISRQNRCCICQRKLDDEASIARGIGSECWQGLLDYMGRAA